MNLPFGIALIAVGGWIISVGLGYPTLWFLPGWGLAVSCFGLYYFFRPETNLR